MKLVDTYNNILLQEYSNKIISFLTNKFKKENPQLDDDIILKYINYFDKIKLSLYPTKRDITKYSWNELKGTVLSKLKDKPKNTTVKFKNTEPIYNKNNLKIYLSNSKEACAYYGNGYNFCISSRGDENRYNQYRFERGKEYYTIYFVFDEDKSNQQTQKKPSHIYHSTLNHQPNNIKPKFREPNHLLVILVPHNPQIAKYRDERGKYIYTPTPKEEIEYLVTNANNNEEEFMVWEDISEIQPKLTNLQDLFVSVDAEPKELNPKKIEMEYQAKLLGLNKRYMHSLRNTGVIGISEFDDYNKNKLYNFLNDSSGLMNYIFYDDDNNSIELYISQKYQPEVLDHLKRNIELRRNKKVHHISKEKFKLNDEERKYILKVKELFDSYESELKEAIFLSNQS